MKSRLIGAVLVEKGLITTEQLEVALGIQAKTDERLGEIVVAEFGVSRLELASVLAEQWAELDATRDGGAPVPPPALKVVKPLTEDEVEVRRPIGEIFVELGFITAEQLSAALAAQRESGARIGEVLVEQGSLSRLDLASALAEQWSALQKLRPPAPVAEPTPWQNGSPAVEPVVPAAVLAEARSEPVSLTELEERLRLIERATATSTTQEDLDRVRLDLREALAALETRIEVAHEDVVVDGLADTIDRLAARLDAVETTTVAEDVAGLRSELEQLRAGPSGTNVLVDLVAAVERLERRPDTADELGRLSAEIASLADRLDEVAGDDLLRQRIAEVAGQARSAESGVQDLALRLDALNALESRLDELALRLPPDGALEELRTELSALGAVQGSGETGERADDIAALAARVDALATGHEHVSTAAVSELTPIIDALSQRVEEFAGGAADAQTEELGSRLESLEEKSRRDDDTLDRLATALEELRARTQTQLDHLGGRNDVEADLDGVRHRLDELASTLERTADVTLIDELRSRVDELASAPRGETDPNSLDDLRAQIRALAERSASIESVEHQLSHLEARIAEIPVDGKLHDEVRMIAESVLGERAALAGEAAAQGRLDTELADVRSRLDELADLPREDVALRERVDEVVARFAGVEAAVESLADFESGVRTGIDRAVANGTDPLIARLDSAESKLGALADLEARIAGLALALEQQPDGERLAGELAEVGQRLDELAVIPQEDQALRERVDEMSERVAGIEAAVESLGSLESGVRAGIDRAVANGTEPLVERLDLAESSLGALAARLDSVSSLEGEISEARAQIAAAEEIRVADALAHGVRLAGVEASSSSHLELLAELDGRLSALATDLRARLDDQALANDVADLRGRIEHLATQDSADELGQRVSSLADRAEAIAGEARSCLTRSSDELYGRIDELAHALSSRIEELNGRLGGLVAREEQDAAAARHVEWLQAELLALRETGAQSATVLHDRIAAVDQAREADRHTSETVLGESLDAVRSELHGQHAALASHVQAQLAEQRAELELARAEHEGERASTARLQSLLEEGLAALSVRITEEIAGARAAAQQETEVMRGEAVSLSGRIDEILGMRYVDLQAGRLADERLAEQLDAVAELRENDAEAARFELTELAARLDVVAGGLHAESAAARAIAEGATAQLADLERQRSEEVAAAGLASAELAARIDEVAVRAAHSTSELERDLRDQIVAIAARVEGHDAAEVEAREELRGELERLASSMGWRLERIEESLASDESAALRTTVLDLERRLDGQTALGEEQVRATERALRKGLAALGERLGESESAYFEAGNTLRRSIERLGAAVVEADARMADQIPLAPLEGCVAFAPTADGYRLIELRGDQPEVGAVLEVEVCDGPLVVTRYGRSPLPFDARPCAYLDRA